MLLTVRCGEKLKKATVILLFCYSVTITVFLHIHIDILLINQHKYLSYNRLTHKAIYFTNFVNRFLHSLVSNPLPDGADCVTLQYGN